VTRARFDRTLLPGAYTATGYHAVETLRTSGRPLPGEGTGDRHLRDHREILGAEGDRLDRDSFVYEGLLNRATEAILGRDGFSPRILTPDGELNKRMTADLTEWCKAPEVTGRHSWQDCENLALRAVWNRGDLGVMRTNLARVQYIEAPRITGGRRAVEASKDGGRIDQGVELDALDRALAYWVAPYNVYGDVDRQRARRISAEDMVLVAHWKKFSQSRGVPVAQTAMPLIHRLNDILDSEAIGWQQLARFTAFFGMDGASKTAHGKSGAEDAKAEYDLADRVVDVEQGTFVFGKPGEVLKGIDRNIPGKQFPESVRMFLRMIGMPFGMPLSFLLLDYSDTTYTASRAEVEQAFRVFIRWQRTLKRQHHDPITRWWIQWGIESGRYPDKPFGEFYRWKWDAPEFPWIDMLKEAQAWSLRIDRALATQNDALLSVGDNFDDFLERRAAELLKARQKAAEVSGVDVKTLPPVDWRLLAGYPVSLTAAQVEDGDEPKKDTGASRKAGAK
jgi:lambda family phage portal protein